MKGKMSPGKQHLRVPKDLRENLEYRRELLLLVSGRSRWQRAVLAGCKQDILFFINVFGWQYNPAHVGEEIGPFITWPCQDEIILATVERLFEERDDALWEKSREWGGTWMALFIGEWLCQFHSWKKVLAISHSEDAVDRSSDPDSLFWKIQFMHDNEADWLKRGVVKRRLGFEYPATNSSLNGSATTERAGVGGRASFVILDEFAKQRKDYEILGQTASTGPRLFISTHYGTGTQFYKLTQRPDLWKKVLHWSEHEEKCRGLYRYDVQTNRIDVLDKSYVYPENFQFVLTDQPLGGPFPGLRSPWYDHECVRRGNSRDVAMHLDINPEGSVAQVFNPAVILTLVREYCRDPDWEGDLDYDYDLGTPKGLVSRAGGLLKLWFIPDLEGKPPVGRYTFGCDVSTGSGISPSCVSGFRVDTGEKILEYANARIDEKTLAVLVVALCQLFCDAEGQGAMVAWEAAGPGKILGMEVISLGYRNIFMRTREDKVSKVVTDQPGWAATPDNKLVLLTDYRAALSARAFINFSEPALKECLQFMFDDRGYPKHGGETNKDDPAGSKINHGDRVIADALAYKLSKGIAARRQQEEDDIIPLGSLAWRRRYCNTKNKRQEEWA